MKKTDLTTDFADFASQTSPLTQEQAKSLLENFLKNHNTTETEFSNFLKTKQTPALPVSIFQTKKLASLEIITKYLHENKGWRFTKIAKAINRNPRSIASTYRNAKRKQPKSISEIPSEYHIPLSLLSNKQLSVLENLAYYLAVECKLKFSEVAKLLGKDPRTIWTVMDRATKKLDHKKGLK